MVTDALGRHPFLVTTIKTLYLEFKWIPEVCVEKSEIDIRPVALADCSAYIEFVRSLDNETTFLLWEPDERNRDFDAIKQRLEKSNLKKQVTLVAVQKSNGDIVGFLSAIVGGTRRISHRPDFAMGVLKAFQGTGIGSILFM